MKKILLLASLSAAVFMYGQTVAQRVDKSVQELMASAPMFSGNISVYIADQEGNKIYDFNGNKGLSTASTMKVFTAAAAMDVLGRGYTYKTFAALDRDLYISSNGDPTLGSSRYEQLKPQEFIVRLTAALKARGIHKIEGDLILDDACFDFQKIPGGWPYNDIGNYYGAGVWGINWRENQFDIQAFGNKIKSIGLSNTIKAVNELRTQGQKDGSIVYTHPYLDYIHINGTLPAREMTVSGASPNPPRQLASEIIEALAKQKIIFSGKVVVNSERMMNGEKPLAFPQQKTILTYESPALEKLVYWFLKKSVNLYGEALVKTMAKEKTASPTFESGINFLKDFWKQKGIDPRMINFADGSGLSPQNYASAKAEVQALLWARSQPWFKAFFDGFPVQANGMRMKSGTIKDCKAFAGYHTSEEGKTYVFSVIMNNYQAPDLSEALYGVLNNLK